MATFTRDQILEAASTCTTITALAQRLGCCGSKLSGGTASRLRAIVPELDELLKANKGKGSSTVCPSAVEKPSQNVPPDSDNPYRPGSVYEVIFHEGSQRFQTKADLISRVAELTAKSIKSVGYSLAVLCTKSHSSNLGRSTALRDDVAGKIKLISLSRKPVH